MIAALARNSFLRRIRLSPIKLPALCLALLFAACTPALAAQRAKKPAIEPAPVPPQIAAAQKVFISNGGGATLNDALGTTVVSGGPDRAYNEFYAAMKGWGRYDLVDSPAGADLVFQVSFTLSGTGLEHWASNGTSFTKIAVLGPLRVVILDPKTHVVLWTIVEYVPGAVLLGNRDKNFSQSMNTAIDRLKKLAEPPKAAPAP